MSESITSIHLCDSQSTPPFHHLSDDSFTFPDSLAPLVLPVDPLDIADTDARKVTRLWPSSVPLYTLAELSYLQGCKDQIIKILELGRNKKLGNGLQTASARVLTHHQYTDTFLEETRMLDRLLMSVFTCTTFTKDVVYKMDENLYQELCTKLTTRCAIASSSLKAFGYSELRPPVWAIDTTKGLTANDFEIYALQYRIRIEHFLYMLDDVQDWDKLQTRVYLDERLLSAQRNADRARLGTQEYYLPTVPPASHSNPLKSNPSHQNSVSDWSLGGVHYDTSRDKEQLPSNLQTTKIRGQSCLCANSKVSESHDFAGPCRHEIWPAASRKVQTPNGLDCKNPSSHAIFYQERPPSDLDSGQGHTDGNKHLFHHDSCNPQISACSDHSEFTSIYFDTTLKAVDIRTIEHSSPNTGISCEKRCNDTPVPNHNISNSILPHSTNSELRTFRIASNTPCAPFSGENKSSLLPRRVRRRIHQLRKRLQQALHHSTFNIINRQRQLKRRRECLQRPSCLRSKVSQCFTSKKSAPTLSSVHLQTAVRITTSHYKNTAMAATGTNPISRSQQSHKFASTPTTENTDRHNNIECTTEPDPLPQIHAKLRLHEYNSHLTSPRGENQTHLLTKPQSITSLSNGSRGKYITSLMSPRVTLTVPSDSDFKLSKEEGNRRTGSMRKLDQIRDPGINICGMVEINIVPDNETGYFDLRGKNPQPDTISRASEPMVSITPQKEGHGDQHHQYHSYFGNNSPTITKAHSLCYCCTMKLPSIFASPKRHSCAPCIHKILFPEENVSQDSYWHQGEDLSYLPVSQLFVLRMTNSRNALTSVGNRNTVCPVRIPHKRFYRVHRGIQGMKRRRRTVQRSQRIRTVHNMRRLTVRIKTQRIINAAFEELGTTGCELITTSFRHLPVSLADVHRALSASQISRFPEIHTTLRDIIAGPRDQRQRPQRIRCSSRFDFLCQLTLEISMSLTTAGSWHATSPVCIPGICTGSQGMKRQPCNNPKSWCTRTARKPHRLAIRINAQTIPDTASEELSTASSRELFSKFLHFFPSFAFHLADRERGEFLIRRDLCKLRNSRSPEAPRMLRYLIAGHRIEVEKATVPSTINRECQLYRWMDRNRCHPKCQSLRRGVQAQKYSMMSPGHNFKVKVNMKPQTTRRNLYTKQHLNRETHWQQEDFDLPSVGNCNMNRGVHTTRLKWLSEIRWKFQRMKRRLHATRKDQLQGAKVVLDPRRAIRNKANPIAKSISEEKFSIASGYECTTTFFRDLPRFTLADKERREFHVNQALHKSQDSRLQEDHAMLRDLIAKLIDGQNHLQRIQSSSRLEFCHQLIPELIIFHGVSAYPGLSIIAEAAVIKNESKRRLTYHPPSVVFKTVSLKLNWTEKTEHNELNPCVRLINSLDDALSGRFITSIAISFGFISGHAETSFLARSTSLAPTAPGPSADDIKVLSLKPRIHTPGDEIDNTEASKQCQKLDTILSVNGTKAGSIRRRNDRAHHQYRSRFGNGSHEPAAHADSQLRRMQPRASSTRISPATNLGAYRYGNHFQITIIVHSGHSSTHSFTVSDRAPKLDFSLILDPSTNEKSVHDSNPECGEPFPPYVEDVG